MEDTELRDIPGLVISQSGVKRTTKVKKFIEKNKLEQYKIIYLPTECGDFRDVERALKELENKYLGLSPIKEKEKRDQYSYAYTYRINETTLLCAGNEEDFNKLKEWYHVK